MLQKASQTDDQKNDAKLNEENEQKIVSETTDTKTAHPCPYGGCQDRDVCKCHFFF